MFMRDSRHRGFYEIRSIPRKPATVAEIGEGVSTVSRGDHGAVRPLCFGAPASFDKGFSHVGKNLKFIGIDMPGGMQSSWTVPAYTLHRLPDSLNLQHGAMIEPTAVACHDVRLGEARENSKHERQAAYESSRTV